MIPQENQSDETAPAIREEVSDETDKPSQMTPVLNRAERRAQAKGKKGAGAALQPDQAGNVNARTSGNRIGGAVGQNRLPRTGHK